MYILECADKSLYTGWTVDLDKRLKNIMRGKASKYTRARLPVKLVYYEIYDNKIDTKKEWYIKSFLERKS